MQKTLLIAMAAVAAFTPAARGADYTAPCTVPCNTEETFAQWTVIDLNKDESSNTFQFNSSKNAADYTFDRWTGPNEWLISPGFELEAGVDYEVIALMCGSSITSDKEKFTFNIGTSPTVEGMTTTVFTKESYNIGSSFVNLGGVDNGATVFTPTEAGTYYFGLHLYSDRYMGHVYLSQITVKKVVPLPGEATAVSAKAADAGVLEATVSWTMPTLTSAGATLESLSGAKIYRGTSSYFSIDDSSLIGTYQGGTPGQQCSWADQTLTSGGKYYYAVRPFNENGDAPKTPTRVQSDWIGFDTGVKAVASVTATLVEGTEKTIKIVWPQPEGKNGAAVDYANLAYRIVRKANVAGTSVELETAYAGNEYTDNTIESLDSYTYTIYTVYNGDTSYSGTTSAAVMAGGALTPPYSQDFTNKDALALWTIFHVAPATRDWDISSYEKALNFWGDRDNGANAWAVMPPMSLKTGVPYKLTFSTWVSNDKSPKNLYVYCGNGSTAEALEQNQIFYEKIENYISSDRCIILSVPSDGVYYVAFRCYGISNVDDLFIDNLQLEECEVAPADIEAFTAEAAPKGALQAILTWTNPAKDNTGGDLAEITKVEIKRGNDLIATITENLTPGAVATYTDNTLTVPGKYTYSVAAYMGDKCGEASAATTGWVGFDTPLAPATVEVTVGDDGRTITFAEVTEAVNGGYLDTETLHYVVRRNEDVLDDNVASSPFTDDDATLPFGDYTYSVKAVAGELESAETSATSVKFGAPQELPFASDFANKDHASLWTLTGDSPNNTWTVYSSGFSTFLRAYWATKNSWAFTPLLHIVHSKVKLTMEGECYSSSSPETIEVYLSKSTNHANAEDHQLVLTKTFTTGDHETAEVDFEVYPEGSYYIGYRLPTNANQARIYNTSLVTTQVLTGVEDVDADKADALLYSATFDCIQAPEGATVVICDAAGRIVLEAVAGEGTVSTAELAPGIYVATAVSGSEKLSAKFAKH